MLFLHELKQVLVLVKQFTSASSIETFLWSKYYSHDSTFSHSVVCKRRNLVNAFKFSKWRGPFSQMCSTRLVQYRCIDMNKSQSCSLPSLSFLSADLTWLDMYIWLSLLNPCHHSGETWYNLTIDAFDFSIAILKLLIKSNHN